MSNVTFIAAGGYTSAAISTSSVTSSDGGNYSISVNISSGGTVMVSPKYTGYNLNDVATVSAMASPHMQFDSWNVTNGMVTPGTSLAILVVSGNVTFSANFVPAEYPVTGTDPDGYGSVSPDSTTASYNQVMTFVATPANSGCVFAGWTLNGSGN